MTGKKKDGGAHALQQSAEVKKFAAAGRGKKCPSCGSPVDTRYRPFCSRRCAELDLGRWFREDYRIPTQEPPEGDEEQETGYDGDRWADPS
jgi:endogenous inhibitor of DNA gyrase (YacG/DUF329 family)